MNEKAEKRKKFSGIKKTAWLCLLFCPITLFLGIFLSNIDYFLGGTFIIISLICFIFSISSFKEMKKYCSYCRAYLEGCAYECTPVYQRAVNVGSHYQYHVRFTIISYCPDCGKKMTETKEFTSNDGYGDCQLKLNDYCIRKFGH